MDSNSPFQPSAAYPPDAYSLDQQQNQQQRFQYFSNNTWPPMPFEQTEHMDANNNNNNNNTTDSDAAVAGSSSQQSFQRRAETIATTSALGIRTSMPTATSIPPLQTAGFGYSQSIDPSAALLSSADLQFNLLQDQSAYTQQANTMDPLAFTGTFGVPLQTSPIEDFLPTTTQEQIHNSLASSYNLGMVTAPMDSLNDMPFQFDGFNALLTNQAFANQTSNAMPINPATFSTHSSPHENWLDARSFSSHSENSWTIVDLPHGRQSLDGFSDISNHGVVSPQHLHVRTDSNSSGNSDGPPLSARSVGSYEEIFPVSPEPECSHNHNHAMPMPSPHYHHSPMIQSPMPSIAGTSIAPRPSHASTASSSPSSSASSPSTASSPKSKRRNSPISVGITPKVISKKKASVTSVSKDKPEKKVGRRRGPLRPEQRQQAHEIRKLRACLRCKFLKKVCDKGDPCGGCQPSHARLWQVPCTRIDIKDINYFLKDYNVDFERHVTLGFSVANIKGFSQQERILYITHGYGFCLPIWAREVYVHDETCFEVDWTENTGDNTDMKQFDVGTAKLSAGMEGVSRSIISEYLDAHLDQGFEKFVDEYFEGTPFLTQLLKTIYRYYVATQMPVLRKGLKFVIAYALTLHITLITGLTEEESEIGKIEDPGSRYYGQTCAPVMINFQVKKAMADTWRELMKDILEELSALYSSVYSGEKLKNWPTIFMLAALILAIWELMQFDANYRSADEGYISKFCNEMESVPVGVIVGLFCAISTKLPSFLEWDTRKHAHVLNNNAAVCDAMTEVRNNVKQHESYLKKRPDVKFNRDDFDCLSSKFLSKLVIRAN